MIASRFLATARRLRRWSRFRLMLLVGVATLLLVTAISFATRQRGQPAAQKSYAELVAANYRVLTAAQTRHLLRFADAFYACMSKKGIEIGEPKPLNTKIEMALPPGAERQRADRQRIARIGLSCGDALGGPPPGASLQTIQPGGKAIVLYLPKQCLLDRKTLDSVHGA